MASFSGVASARGMTLKIPLDETLGNICEEFIRNNETAEMCQEHLKEKIFSKGMKISIQHVTGGGKGSGRGGPRSGHHSEESTPAFQRHIDRFWEPFAKDALDELTARNIVVWRWRETPGGIQPYVAPWGFYTVIMHVEPDGSRYYLVYNKNGDKTMADPNYHVWVYKHPSLDGIYRSKVVTLLQTDHFQHAYQNWSMIAARNAAAPTLITQTRKDGGGANGSVGILTGSAFGTNDVAMERTRKRLQETQTTQGAMAEMFDYAQGADALMSGNVREVHAQQMRRALEPGSMQFRGNTLALPPEQEIAKNNMPTFPAELVKNLQLAQETICGVLGVPRATLIADSARQTATGTLDKTFAATIEARKKILSEFVSDTYETIYGRPQQRLPSYVAAQSSAEGPFGSNLWPGAVKNQLESKVEQEKRKRPEDARPPPHAHAHGDSKRVKREDGADGSARDQGKIVTGDGTAPDGTRHQEAGGKRTGADQHDEDGRPLQAVPSKYQHAVADDGKGGGDRAVERTFDQESDMMIENMRILPPNEPLVLTPTTAIPTVVVEFATHPTLEIEQMIAVYNQGVMSQQTLAELMFSAGNLPFHQIELIKNFTPAGDALQLQKAKLDLEKKTQGDAHDMQKQTLAADKKMGAADLEGKKLENDIAKQEFENPGMEAEKEREAKLGKEALDREDKHNKESLDREDRQAKEKTAREDAGKTEEAKRQDAGKKEEGDRKAAKEKEETARKDQKESDSVARKDAKDSEATARKDAKESEATARKDAKTSEETKRKDAKASEDLKAKTSKESEDLKAKTSKESEDLKAKTSKESEDLKRKDAKESEGLKRKDAKESDDVKRKDAAKTQGDDKKQKEREYEDGKKLKEKEYNDNKKIDEKEYKDQKSQKDTEYKDQKSQKDAEYKDQKGQKDTEFKDKRDQKEREFKDKQAQKEKEGKAKEKENAGKEKEKEKEKVKAEREGKADAEKKEKEKEKAQELVETMKEKAKKVAEEIQKQIDDLKKKRDEEKKKLQKEKAKK
jgi:hypothetical protein